MDDFSQPGLSNYYGYAPSPANFIKPCKINLDRRAKIALNDRLRNFELQTHGFRGIRTMCTSVWMRFWKLNEPFQTHSYPHSHEKKVFFCAGTFVFGPACERNIKLHSDAI